MKKEKMSAAYFTEFKKEETYCAGEIDKFVFTAKLFDERSDYGIKKGRVSILDIRNKETRELVVYYNRGWEVKPGEESKPYFKEVMRLLENAPKRFS
jgi:hypothetical protein